MIIINKYLNETNKNQFTYENLAPINSEEY